MDGDKLIIVISPSGFIENKRLCGLFLDDKKIHLIFSMNVTYGLLFFFGKKRENF